MFLYFSLCHVLLPILFSLDASLISPLFPPICDHFFFCQVTVLDQWEKGIAMLLISRQLKAAIPFFLSTSYPPVPLIFCPPVMPTLAIFRDSSTNLVISVGFSSGSNSRNSNVHRKKVSYFELAAAGATPEDFLKNAKIDTIPEDRNVDIHICHLCNSCISLGRKKKERQIRYSSWLSCSYYLRFQAFWRVGVSK